MKSLPAEPTTRELIVQAADALFYHFKTKDEILSAVIALRAAKTQTMLSAWADQEITPLGRLSCFADMLIQNRKDIQRYGCPVGTLCAELSKLEHPAAGEAGMIFGQFRRWLREQFEAMGIKTKADTLAMHLLARSQGVAALANAFHDESFIRHEVRQIEEWLQSIPVEHTKKQAKTA